MIDDAQEYGIVDYKLFVKNLFDQKDFPTVFYYDEPCYLTLEIFTSCKVDQSSADAGEGKGGKWMNEFIAKSDFGEAMKNYVYECEIEGEKHIQQA